MYDRNPPMGLGETMKGTDEDGTLINSHWLGQTFTLPAPVTDSPGKRPTGRTVDVVVLRNVAGFALLGKRLGQLFDSAGYPLVGECEGYTITLAERNAVVIDPYLPAAGVPDDDLFLGVINGVVPILTPHAGTDFPDDIAVGAQLVAATVNTTNGNSTAGRVGGLVFVAATAADTNSGMRAYQLARGHVGVACSARTTGETGADLLCNVQLGRRF